MMPDSSLSQIQGSLVPKKFNILFKKKHIKVHEMAELTKHSKS